MQNKQTNAAKEADEMSIRKKVINVLRVNPELLRETVDMNKAIIVKMGEEERGIRTRKKET